MRMLLIVTALSVVAAGSGAAWAHDGERGGRQETRKVPSDSVEVEARGCLKGRVFTGTGQAPEERTAKSPDVTGKSFRLTGEREAMELVKKYNGQFVEAFYAACRSTIRASGCGSAAAPASSLARPGPTRRA
jgi:hypothetical protein